MLVLSRKRNQTIAIQGGITITVIEQRGDKVRIGIEAPKDRWVHRGEVLAAILARGDQPGTNAEGGEG